MKAEDAPCDVFISYARPDRARAEKFAELIRRRGWTAFYDADLVTGDDYRARLDREIQRAKCVLVLWSQHSLKSRFVKDEAEFGLSRQVLASITIDGSMPPLGFGGIHTEDLSGWTDGSVPAGMVPLIARIKSLVEDLVSSARSPDADLLLGQRQVETRHISVSDLAQDKTAVLDRLPDVDEKVRKYISTGYTALEQAQHAARHVLDDLASVKHYASAASLFGQALDALGPLADRIARDRSIRYFLSMEQANSLALSEPRAGEAYRKALEIYGALSEEPRYFNDAPVFFRLGSAQAREAREEEQIQTAIRNLSSARRLALEADQRAKKDELLAEGNWLYYDVPRQLGFCNFKLSQLPGISPAKRAAFLQAAIRSTREVLERPKPGRDPSDLIRFTVLKARGNLIFLLATLTRAGRTDPRAETEIRQQIAALRSEEYGEIVEKQVRIIDSIAFAAATIGDWETAVIEAEKNIDNFQMILLKRHLDEQDHEMLGRAQEIAFFGRQRLAS